MKIIPIELYNTNVKIISGSPNHPILKKYLKGAKFEPGPTCCGITLCADDRGPLIWVKNRKDISILCHEVVHASYNILSNAGVDIDPENHEALTYLVGYILKNIL